MAVSGWQAVVQDHNGRIQPGAEVTVRRADSGVLATLYSNRSGTTTMPNPFLANSEGYLRFFAVGGAYRVSAVKGMFSTEWPYVAVGTAQELDIETIAQIRSSVSFATVAALLADEAMSYDAGENLIVVGPGDLIEAQGFHYEVAASGATDVHVETSGGVKLYARPAADGTLNVLQFGAKRDWVDVSNMGTDDRVAFNTALVAARDTGVGVVVVPAGHYGVTVDTLSDQRGPAISLVDNVRLWLQNAEIHLWPNDIATTTATIAATGVKGASLYGDGVIWGDRDDHIDTGGQAGMALRCYDVEDFYAGPNIAYNNTWGDGIYFGEFDQSLPTPPPANKNIVLDNPKGTNNRRNFLSIIYCDGMTVNNLMSRDLNGEIFEYSIDVEPNQPDQHIKNLTINGMNSINPSHGAISILLQNHDNTTEPVSITVNDLYCRDAGLESSNNERGAIRLQGPNAEAHGGGTIVFNNPVCEDIDRQLFTFQRWAVTAPKVIINNPVGRNFGRNTWGGSAVRRFAFYHGSDLLPTTQNVGNIVINNPHLDGGGGLCRFEAGTGLALENILVANPTFLNVDSTPIQLISPEAAINLTVKDEFEKARRFHNSNTTITQTTLATYHETASSPNISFNSNIPIGFEMTFQHIGTGTLTLIATTIDPTLRFFPFDHGRMATNEKGARVTFRRVAGGFMVSNRIGTWTDTTP